MKCTGLKAVSYPDTQHLIKGSTVQICTNARIFYIVCYGLAFNTLNYVYTRTKSRNYQPQT
jgi:hypothetical protein